MTSPHQLWREGSKAIQKVERTYIGVSILGIHRCDEVDGWIRIWISEWIIGGIILGSVRTTRGNHLQWETIRRLQITKGIIHFSDWNLIKITKLSERWWISYHHCRVCSWIWIIERVERRRRSISSVVSSRSQPIYLIKFWHSLTILENTLPNYLFLLLFFLLKNQAKSELCIPSLNRLLARSFDTKDSLFGTIIRGRLWNRNENTELKQAVGGVKRGRLQVEFGTEWLVAHGHTKDGKERERRRNSAQGGRLADEEIE